MLRLAGQEINHRVDQDVLESVLGVVPGHDQIDHLRALVGTDAGRSIGQDAVDRGLGPVARLVGGLLCRLLTLVVVLLREVLGRDRAGAAKLGADGLDQVVDVRRPASSASLRASSGCNPWLLMIPGRSGWRPSSSIRRPDP